MNDHQKTICFLAYHWPHVKLFKSIKTALPNDVRGSLKLVHALLPLSLCRSSASSEDIPEADLAKLTEAYCRKKICMNPEIDTPEWRERMKRRSIQWYRLFLGQLKDADMLVLWNGFGVPRGAAATAARALGKKIVLCDNGVLPGTIAMDAKGVNFNCSLTGKSADFYRSFSPDQTEAETLWQTVWPQRPLRTAITKKDEVDLDENRPLPERYILYAMQVLQDTQIQMFSPWFHSMHESISYVYEQVKEHNKRTGDNLTLVVKEHPSDYGRVDYSGLRASMPDARFMRSTPIRDLIKSAKATVTVNSSVGVEALFSNSPVITLGQAFFNVPGLVHHIEPGEKLADALPDLLRTPVDDNLRKSFLYFLWKHYLVPRPDRDPNGAQRCADRLTEILEDRLAW